jgi:hypothetical protein
MPRNTATKPPKQSGSQGSRAQGSRRPLEVDSSEEEFNFAIDGDREGSEGIGSQSQTQKTSKSAKADDIGRLFKVNDTIGKRVCTLCG